MRVVSLALVLAAAASAQDPLVTEGFQHFYNLRYEDAIRAFSAYAARRPDDPAAYNHLAESILYRNIFRAGALETEMVTGNNPFLTRPKVDASAADRKAFEDYIARAESLAEGRLRTNERDEQALYDLGVSYGIETNYDFLVRKAWRDALRHATAARRAHARITSIDPDNVDARMVQGLYDYLVGSLPLHLRMLGFLVGFHGDREAGLRQVEAVAAHGKNNRVEAEFLLCALYRREKSPQRAIPLLQDLIQRFPGNFLLRMELAQMYSETHQPAPAIAALEQVRALKLAGTPGYAPLRTEKIDFAEGNIQFWYNQLDAALGHMRRAATAANELDLNTGVLAWMRLGQIYDLRGLRAEAEAAYSRAIDLAPASDAAKESRQYLRSPYRRRSNG